MILDWRIGNRTVEWSRIDIGLVMDWRWIGRLVMDWQIGNGLVDWSRIDVRLAMDWR